MAISVLSLGPFSDPSPGKLENLYFLNHNHDFELAVLEFGHVSFKLLLHCRTARPGQQIT